MHEFTPAPRYDSQWWRSQEVLNALVPPGWETWEPLTPEAWIVGAVYESEPYAPLLGYALRFDTPTDCLLWFRWWVLPSMTVSGDEFRGVEVALDGQALQLAQRIDGAPPGSSSATILGELTQGSSGIPVTSPLYIAVVTPIGEFLRRAADDPSAWAATLGADAVHASGADWVLTPAGWTRLARLFTEILDGSDLSLDTLAAGLAQALTGEADEVG